MRASQEDRDVGIEHVNASKRKISVRRRIRSLGTLMGKPTGGTRKGVRNSNGELSNPPVPKPPRLERIRKIGFSGCSDGWDFRS